MWLSEWDVQRAVHRLLPTSDAVQANAAIENLSLAQKAGFVTLIAQGESWRVCAELVRKCPDGSVVEHCTGYARALAAGYTGHADAKSAIQRSR